MVSFRTTIRAQLFLTAILFLLVNPVFSAPRNPTDLHSDSSIVKLATIPTMAEHKPSEQEKSNPPVSNPSTAAPIETNQEDPHPSDDEPMVFFTPVDYKAWAREERARRIASGADPETVILQSEVGQHVPRKTEQETAAEYGKRYSDTMNAMIRRGVTVLNDQCSGNVKPNGYSLAGKKFYLGPEVGTTKGEYRRFNRWWSEAREGEAGLEVPEEFARFEKGAVGRKDL